MILKFVFNTTAKNGVIEKILIRVAKEENIKLGLCKDLENIYAYVQGSEEEIENFSRKLANELPLSLFLNSLKAEVSEEFKDEMERNFPDISLPPCPKCIREVKDENNKHYFDIFHHCEVCGYKVNGKWEIENGEFNIKDKNERRKFFKQLAKKLENENIFIQTMNGAFEVSKNIENADFIIAKDLAAIAKYFLSFEGDAKALGSIEKPFLSLKTNIEFKKEFGISTPAFLVKLPDCMVTELLFEVCEYPLLGFKKADKAKDLCFEVKTQEPLMAVVTDSTKKDILIQSGDRGIIPAYEKKLNTDGKYKKYGYKDGVIDLLENLEDIESKDVNPVYAGFYGVLTQWELENKNIMGFCFYEEENKILVNSPKFGLVEFIDFKFSFKNFEEIFAQISAMNETGNKLIKNFMEKRPELFSHAINTDINSDKKGIYYLWGMIGILLNIAESIEEGFEKIIAYSNEAMAKKGPRIDYKMDKNNLNPLWVIRTVMSFNLAGVDNNLISFGVIESFAEFLSNQYDLFKRDSNLDGAVIVGDLFRGQFLNKIYSYIEKNYPVYTPKALQISGGVEAFGSAVINSKIKD